MWKKARGVIAFAIMTAAFKMFSGHALQTTDADTKGTVDNVVVICKDYGKDKQAKPKGGGGGRDTKATAPPPANTFTNGRRGGMSAGSDTFTSKNGRRKKNDYEDEHISYP